MTLWGLPQDGTLGRPEDVEFQYPKNVGRGRPKDAGRDIPWRYIEDHVGTSIVHLLGTFLRGPRNVFLPSGKVFSNSFSAMLFMHSLELCK